MRAAVGMTCSRALPVVIFFPLLTWESQELLDKHMATPEFAQYVAVIQECGTLSVEIMQKV